MSRGRKPATGKARQARDSAATARQRHAADPVAASGQDLSRVWVRHTAATIGTSKMKARLSALGTGSSHVSVTSAPQVNGRLRLSVSVAQRRLRPGGRAVPLLYFLLYAKVPSGPQYCQQSWRNGPDPRPSAFAGMAHAVPRRPLRFSRCGGVSCRRLIPCWSARAFGWPRGCRRSRPGSRPGTATPPRLRGRHRPAAPAQ
jgi:hypothetical protein